MSLTDAVNSSRIAWGLGTLAMQFGARYVVTDLTRMQNEVLASSVGKRLILCGMIFVATRDIMLSVIMTVAFYALAAFLLNEDSAMCVVPRDLRPPAAEVDSDAEVTRDEYEAALRIVQRYQAAAGGGRKHRKPPRLFPPLRTNALY